MESHYENLSSKERKRYKKSQLIGPKLWVFFLLFCFCVGSHIYFFLSHLDTSIKKEKEGGKRERGRGKESDREIGKVFVAVQTAELMVNVIKAIL